MSKGVAMPDARRAGLFLLVGLVALVIGAVAALAHLGGWLAWTAVGVGAGLLLVGAAQRSSARDRRAG